MTSNIPDWVFFIASIMDSALLIAIVGGGMKFYLDVSVRLALLERAIIERNGNHDQRIEREYTKREIERR